MNIEKENRETPFNVSENMPHRVVTSQQITDDERKLPQVEMDGSDSMHNLSVLEASTLGQGGFGGVDEHSGSYAYRLPITVPEAQNGGPTPTISLSYNSQQGKTPSLVANGWRLELGRIERTGDGAIKFKNNQGEQGARDFFVLHFNGSRRTLVVRPKENSEDKNRRFRVKIESDFVDVRYVQSETEKDPISGEPVIDFWEVFDANGTRHQYGHKEINSGDAETDENVGGELINKVWNLTEIEDVYGRRIIYEYKTIRKDERVELPYSYPTRIKSGVTSDRKWWDCEVRFNYTDEDLPSEFNGYDVLKSDYTGRPRTRCVIWERLKEIQTFYRNEDDTFTISQAVLLDVELPTPQTRWLKQIQEVAYKDGVVDETAKLPAHTFIYEETLLNPALMLEAQEPMGKQEKITYGRATELTKGSKIGFKEGNDMFLIDTFTEVIVTELIGEGPKTESWTKHYEYHDALFFLPFNEYRGHGKVITIDNETKMKTVSLFEQNGVHNGYPSSSISYDTRGDGHKISETKTQWMALDYKGGRYLPFTQKTTTTNYDEDGVTVLSTTVSEVPKTGDEVWEYALDHYGNVLIQEITVFEGDEAEGNIAQRSRTLTQYLPVTAEQPFIGLAIEVKTEVMEAGEWILTSWLEKTYNDKAQVTSESVHFDRDNPQSIYRTETTYLPDIGKVEKEYRFNGAQRLLVSCTQYHESGGARFLPRKIANAIGQFETIISYDLQNRSATRKQLPTGMVVEYRYDGLGRLKEELFLGHIEEGQRAEGNDDVQYVYTISPSELSIQTIRKNTGAKSTLFMDALDRKLRTIDSGYQDEKMIVKEDTEYDHKTRKAFRVWEPYYIEPHSAYKSPQGDYSESSYDDPRLRLKRTTHPSGKIVEITYAGLKQLTEELVHERDEQGAVGKFLYRRVVEEVTNDVLGRSIARREGKGNTRYEVYFKYDFSNRVIQITDSLGVELETTKYGSRLDDKQIEMTDINLGTARITYDGLGRIERSEEDQQGALDRVTVFGYDNLDREIYREEHTGESKRIINAEFDTAENGKGLIANQQVLETGPDGHYCHRQYFSYDKGGMPKSQRQQWEINWPEVGEKRSAEFEMKFQHNTDKGGRLERLVYPGVSQEKPDVVNYLYDDKTGLVKEVQHNDHSIWKLGEEGVTPRHTPHGVINGNGTKTTFAYEAATGWTQSISVTNGDNELLGHNITYDTAGNVLHRAMQCAALDPTGETRPHPKQERYEYDDKNQLIQATLGNDTQQYGYLANGGRYRFVDASGETNYEHNGKSPHQVTGLQGAEKRSLSYDTAGNLVKETNFANGAVRELTWNAANKLGGVQYLSDQGAIRRLRYGYRTDDERAIKYDSETDCLTLYFGTHCEVDLYRDKNHSRLRCHIATGAKRLMTVERSQRMLEGEHHEEAMITYHHRDHLGSVNLNTDANGGVLNAIEYDPFGRVLTESGERDNDLLYAGHRADVVNVLGFSQYDFKARLYDPNLGQFVSPDDVEDVNNTAFGRNRYVYVGNNPMTVVDPTGNATATPAEIADVKTIMNQLRADLYGLVAQLSKDKWYASNEGRLVVNKMRDLIDTAVFEVEFQRYTKTNIALSNGGFKTKAEDVFVSSQGNNAQNLEENKLMAQQGGGGAWHEGKTYVSVFTGNQFPRHKNKTQYPSVGIAAQVDPKETLFTLANESVHAINNGRQNAKNSKGVETRSQWEEYNSSLVEKKVRSIVGNKKQQTMAMPNMKGVAYAGASINESYRTVGSDYFIDEYEPRGKDLAAKSFNTNPYGMTSEEKATKKPKTKPAAGK